MFPNRGPWSTFPSPNLQYPYYYSGAFHSIYTSAANVPPSVPHGSGRSSLPVATPLIANAGEFAPTGTVDPPPVTPPSGFPLPKRSSVINISNPIMGGAVVLRPPDPANAAGAARVQRPTQPESPLSKKERKRMANSNVGEKEKQEREEGVEKVRLWLEGKIGNPGGRRPRRTRNAEGGERKREEEETKKLEEELKTLVEEMRKEEEELKRREEERRKAEEELRKLEEEHRIQQDSSERARKEREDAETNRKAEKEQKHELSNLEGLSVEPGEKVWKVNDHPTTITGRAQARKLDDAFAPSSFASAELCTPPHNRDSSVTEGRPEGQDTQQLSSSLPVEPQESSEETAAEVANHHTLSEDSDHSRQIEILLQEIKDLRNEVQELRRGTKGGDRKAHSKSPQRESSVPEVSRTATAINRYFITKKGELDFCPGDVITILDAPQDTPRGWMYGEINVTKRGFFPASYVKLEQ